MKTLNRTIIALVALSLLAAGFASANNAPEAPVLPSTPSPAPVPVQATPPTPPIPTAVSVSAVNDDLFSLTQGLSYGSRSAGADSVLVIPSGQIQTEEIITINEDMSVMSRIFQKNLEQARISTSYGGMFASRRNVILPLLRGGRDQIQSLYLQGYGALFLMKVDFPLSPSPDAQQEEEQPQKEPEGDPVWQEIRQEMYEPHKVDRGQKIDQQGEKYDAEKVENLKTTLIKALKHAMNIRSLKLDESVILMITGSSESTGTIIASARRLPGENQVLIQQKSADGKTVNRIVQGSDLDNIGSATPSIIVIRAKKSQIDEFAKGQVDFDRFRQSVQILTYPLLSGAIGSSGSRNMYGF